MLLVGLNGGRGSRWLPVRDVCRTDILLSHRVSTCNTCTYQYDTEHTLYHSYNHIHTEHGGVIYSI